MKLFIHGLESSNQGKKAVYFKEHFPDMVIPNFTGDLPERMDKLKRILEGKTGIIMAGSSYGGLMASLFAMEYPTRVQRLILLAPAINFIETSGYRTKKLTVPTWVFHGIKDDVIPLRAVEEASDKYFTNPVFSLVDDDHFLSRTFDTIDWPMLLLEGDKNT
ncbi:MAG: alpha/beta fold hydrolase [Deltaproteobacteria bacterium]|nr:alpha/beta fold hydrolase [Deltaproteobacteria bacterium]